MKILVLLAAAAIGCFSFASCDKGDNENGTQVSKTDNISKSSWKLEDAGPDTDRNGVIDQSGLALVATCLQDNTITFNRDGSGITDEGSTKCSTTAPQTTPLNWSFADAEANINVNNSALTPINGKSKILELSATSLILSKDTTFGGFSTVFIVKLKH